jgi:hypothetical protein
MADEVTSEDGRGGSWDDASGVAASVPGSADTGGGGGGAEGAIDSDVCHPPCQRILIAVHKMGFILTLRMVQNAYNSKHQAKNHAPPPLWNITVQHQQLTAGNLENYNGIPAQSINQSFDYRHVLVTRNLEEAAISGYFYHRSGRECWLNPNGGRNRDGSEFQGWLGHDQPESRNWEKRLMAPNRTTSKATAKTTPIRESRSSSPSLMYPPVRGRNLCQYLADESPQHGFLVYLEWAYSLYFKPLWSFYETRQQQEIQIMKMTTATNMTDLHDVPSTLPSLSSRRKTLHVCYEDLLHDYDETVASITKHFAFDSGYRGMNQYDASKRTAGATTHGTSKNATLVDSLRSLYRELDVALFNGSLQKWDTEFGCGSRI